MHRRSTANRRHPRVRLLAAGTLIAAVATACDVPTELPEIETRWVVPTEETRFGVAELLPGDVTLNADSSAFLVDFDPVLFAETLGTLCPPCAAADGFTVPKPAFIGTVSSTVDMPPEVSEIDLIGGQVLIDVFNGFNFDPIRPASGVFGELRLTIRDDADGDVLGTLVVDGANQAFAVGATLMLAVPLQAASVQGSIEAEVVVDSPLGDDVQIDASSQISVTAAPSAVEVGSVVIDVASRAVTLDPVELGVEDVDESLTDRIIVGDFILDVVNPFGISADFQITIDGPTIAPIQKSASIGPEPESTVRLSFTGEELRSFLGQPQVVLAGDAVVDPGASEITVLPGQELILSAAIDLVLRIGG